MKLAKMPSSPEIILSMRLGDKVFLNAMERPEKNHEEPKGHHNTTYNIGELKSRGEVYYQLKSCC
ncbi:hypothetical protein F4823DRAFT_578800 [Ustulina deusta]|nr:hypothetical protein F4823DRAFT_578800 [Ustulina deusta]